jgi:murein DD-endopeptidase MepM/ murein hydrolase activator NlpD
MRIAPIFLLLLSSFSFASAYQIVAPKEVKQGDPLHVFIFGEDSSRIVQIEFDGEKRWPFILERTPHAIFGIPLDAPLGMKEIIITDIKASSTIIRKVNITGRPKPKAQFDIPQKLGGNTKKGEETITAGMSKDNELLSGLTSSPRRLWSERFAYPLRKNYITDTYGYSRVTGGTVVSHKGLDLRAPVGTPVYAMNRGVVRLAKKLTLYGNTVVIDHGQGIQTWYMHLNKLAVEEGKVIEKGTFIGYSGNTGYANGAHLHISVRVSGTSIDPLLFMRYVGVR